MKDTDPMKAKRRAEEIFERAMASYRRGDVRQARTDAMLARVFDPDHAGYAKAERTWSAEISRTGAHPRLCSAPSSHKSSTL